MSDRPARCLGARGPQQFPANLPLPLHLAPVNAGVPTIAGSTEHLRREQTAQMPRPHLGAKVPSQTGWKAGYASQSSTVLGKERSARSGPCSEPKRLRPSTSEYESGYESVRVWPRVSPSLAPSTFGSGSLYGLGCANPSP